MGRAIDSFILAHLPIVKAYAERMGLVEVIDQALPCGMKASPGKVTLGLVMNVLCGRSPLYRVEEFFGTRDVEMLLGEGMSAGMLNDDGIGRVLDRIHDYGTWKIFSEVCLHAFRKFSVDCSVVHQDTTSVSVWGDYKPDAGDPMRIVHGFSKDKRPDLKQFIVSLLCVEGNLPCHAGILDGNAADKKTNGKIISELPRIIARHGVEPKGFIYVADSALATEENLSLLGDDILFITRLPENFSVCRELIGSDVGTWQQVGQLSSLRKKTDAGYRLREDSVELYGRTYRALVVHSDAHDRRRQKRIEKAVKKDAEVVTSAAKELSRKEFFCLPDAEKAAADLKQGDFHRIVFSFEARPVYGRGRPSTNGTRLVKAMRYRVLTTINENRTAIEKLKQEAGCFVLLTNVAPEQKTGVDILKIYKEQDGIERNFAFLKDPLVVNDIFLKKPHRIEAMGLIFVLSLLLWRLMERAMREKVRKENLTLQGWNNTTTVKPTSFMMVAKFRDVSVGVKRRRRFLFKPLSPVQLAYLHALGVPPSVFTTIGATKTGSWVT